MRISKEILKRMVLHAQHLYHPPQTNTQEDFINLLRRVGCIQLDAINVLARSQTLFFWSRMENYQPQWIEDLYNNVQGFEAYAHALSLMLIDDFSYAYQAMRIFKQRLFSKLSQPELDYVFDVYRLVNQRGEIESKDIRTTPRFGNQTWRIPSHRQALDYLWRSGMLYVKRTKDFHKRYITIEKIFKDDILGIQISLHDVTKHYIFKTLSALGIASLRDMADYYRIPFGQVLRATEELVRQKLLVEVMVDGIPHSFYAHTEVLPIMATQLKEPPSYNTFLSPFDNLIWYRPRLQFLFDMDYRLEAYMPSSKRKFGYFALPILLSGRLVGTIDLKMDRQKNILDIKNVSVFDVGTMSGSMISIRDIVFRLANFLRVGTLTIALSDKEEIKVLSRLI